MLRRIMDIARTRYFCGTTPLCNIIEINATARKLFPKIVHVAFRVLFVLYIRQSLFLEIVNTQYLFYLKYLHMYI